MCSVHRASDNPVAHLRYVQVQKCAIGGLILIHLCDYDKSSIDILIDHDFDQQPIIILSRKLRSKVPGKMLINACVALIGIYISFLLAIHGEEYRDGDIEECYIVSGVLQYFLLAYFLWTALEAFHICLKLVKVFASDIRNYVFISSLIAWG